MQKTDRPEQDAPLGTPLRRGFREALSRDALRLPVSGIEEVFSYGRNRQGLIPLWVGEGDEPTSRFICEAAAKSMADGETFYTYQGGIPELRASIAAYMAGAYGTPFAAGDVQFSPERFFVSAGGMHALQMAVRLVAEPDSEVLVPTPAWPNFAGAIVGAGAEPVEHPMRFAGHGSGGGWTLDIERLEAATTSRTRAIVINSPSNPTGWVASHVDLEAVLDLARRLGLWIIADEIYGKFVFDIARAPSFHDIIDPDDKVLFVQTMSKNWAMTGWRIGWLEAPAELGRTIENMVQYSTSGVPVPSQRAAVAALEGGAAELVRKIEQARGNRDLLASAFGSTGSMRFSIPQGAFYLFCALESSLDSRTLAMRLIDEAGLGVAPGSAFGAGGEGFVRLCFARKHQDIVEVVARMQAWLEQRGAKPAYSAASAIG